MSSLPQFYPEAQKAANILGIDPDVIYAQWAHETGHFKSPNFIHNNNIAGQTWTPAMGLSKQGTARPKDEGGYYVKYTDPIEGYIDFVQSNNRYDNVKNKTSEYEQIQEFKRAGWAEDNEYVQKVWNVLKSIRNQYDGLDNTAVGAFLTADPSEWLTGDTGGLDSIFSSRLAALAKDKNIKMDITSGYRTIAEQTRLWNDSDKSGKMVAAPGNSRHNYGLAVDITSPFTNLSNSELEKYGLYKPMSYENWHIEPVETKGKSVEQLKDLSLSSSHNTASSTGDNPFKDIDPGFDKIQAGAYSVAWEIDQGLKFKGFDIKDPILSIANNGKALGFRVAFFLLAFILVIFGLIQMMGGPMNTAMTVASLTPQGKAVKGVTGAAGGAAKALPSAPVKQAVKPNLN